MKRVRNMILGASLWLLLVSCSPTVASTSSATVSTPSATVALNTITPIVTVEPTNVIRNTPPPTPDNTPSAPATPTALSTATATATVVQPTITATATPLPLCQERIPSDDLLTIVTLAYSLSQVYTPNDLVPLNDYLATDVTLGYPTSVREIMAEPLAQLINSMKEARLQPQILSGYRSYNTQAAAWAKWLEKEPERAAIISAPPGHSEHQLGTTIDFGSPELPDIVGVENIQFHTYFYKTSEGTWLLNNAHRFGFTLSYPRAAFELTGFYYEPWHYRYVGVELATHLYENETFLTAYQFETQPIPCIANET